MMEYVYRQIITLFNSSLPGSSVKCTIGDKSISFTNTDEYTSATYIRINNSSIPLLCVLWRHDNSYTCNHECEICVSKPLLPCGYTRNDITMKSITIFRGNGDAYWSNKIISLNGKIDRIVQLHNTKSSIIYEGVTDVSAEMFGPIRATSVISNCMADPTHYVYRRGLREADVPFNPLINGLPGYVDTVTLNPTRGWKIKNIDMESNKITLSRK